MAAPRPAPVVPAISAEEEGKIVLTGDKFDVKSDMILAKVAGKDIQLKDLLPTAEGTPERTLTAEEFEALYQQAINREVVFQSARVRRMELDEEQRRLVEKSRLRAAREGMALPDAERPEYEARSNFDSYVLMATLLERNLVKALGGPPAEVTPQVIEKYYEEHKGDFKELPEDEAARQEARQKIDETIREKLQPDVQAAYKEFAKTMLDDLQKPLRIQEYVVLEK
jgi:hypothetical protein